MLHLLPALARALARLGVVPLRVRRRRVLLPGHDSGALRFVRLLSVGFVLEVIFQERARASAAAYTLAWGARARPRRRTPAWETAPPMNSGYAQLRATIVVSNLPERSRPGRASAPRKTELRSRHARAAMPREQMFADKHDSWGASLQAYAKERVTPAWGDTPAPPKDKRMSYYDKSRLERDYNPILMEHRNPAVERARRTASTRGRCSGSTRRATSSCATSKVSTSSITRRRCRASTCPSRRRTTSGKSSARRTRASPTTSSATCRTRTTIGPRRRLRFDEGMRAPPNQPRLLEGGMLPASWNSREFNVISNRYHKSHADRERSDRATLKQEAQIRYWQAHGRSVVGRYYDNTKEDEFHRQRKSLETVQGSCQIARLPPSIQYCEGTAYNILTHDIKDDHKLSIASGIGNRSMKSKKGSAIESSIHARARERAAVQSAGDEQDVAHERDARARGGRHHGYNPITNEAHRGREGARDGPEPALQAGWSVEKARRHGNHEELL